MEGMDWRKLLDSITYEAVSKEVEDGWDGSSIIASHIVGDVWRELDDHERMVLAARVHKIILDGRIV